MIELHRGQLTPPLVITLTDADGNPIDLTVPTSVTLTARNAGGVVFSDRPVSGNAQGVISYAWQAGDTDETGELRFEVELVYGGNTPRIVSIDDSVLVIPTLEDDTSSWFSTDEDVRNVLGTLRDRLPAWVDVREYRSIAHGLLIDRLAVPYSDGIPTFTGAGLTLVRLAEAKLAAAEILEALRVNLPDIGDAPDRLRSSAYVAVDNGVPGYPPGSSDVDDGDPDTPSVPANTGPRVSSFTPLSAVADPYAEARDPLGRFQ